MLRFSALLLAAALARPADACTFCGDSFARRQTLGHHFGQARAVVRGELKNPRPSPDGLGGTTELHVDRVLKADPAVPLGRVVTLPRYIPVVGDTPAGFLVFFGVADGKPDVLHGVPATAAAATYLDGSAGVAAKPPADRLGFYFRHLDAADPTVAADAFLEFARAPDADIAKAAPALDPAKLRLWLADPATPDDRLGVYGMMLGLSGGPADATWLAGLLTASPPAGRVAANFGGLLAGYTLLAPDDGWAITRHVLADPKRHYAERLSAVGTVRYFRATRPKESKDHIVSCYRAALDRPDLADMAVEDLRRWGWWELTADVLAAFDRPTHSAKLFRRGVVRYALSCPRDEAKAWVGRLRSREPELVASVEESLRQFERGGGD